MYKQPIRCSTANQKSDLLTYRRIGIVSTINVNLDFKLTRQTGVNLYSGFGFLNQDFN